MRVLKLTLSAAIVLGFFCYVPVYYHTTEFNRFVREQVQRIRSSVPLKEAILSNASEHQLPVTAQNINITSVDSVLRVKVDYQVPVNFFLFRRDVTFHAVGSGLLIR